MLNVICLQGRLVHEPSIKQTNSGAAVTSFTIAVERNRAGQDGQRGVDYIDIVAWRQTAEFVCKYFTKGSMIAVNGRLETRNYEDKNGNKRKAYEVIADNVHFAGAKQAAQGGFEEQPGNNASRAKVDSEGFAEIEDNEDLPF